MADDARTTTTTDGEVAVDAPWEAFTPPYRVCAFDEYLRGYETLATVEDYHDAIITAAVLVRSRRGPLYVFDAKRELVHSTATEE